MMEQQSLQLRVYALTASDGIKFRLDLPSAYSAKTVKDLKFYFLREKGFPVECQTLFLCKDKKQLELLKDDSNVPTTSRTANPPTLHLYITKSAQQTSLETTRQSDFDDWLKRLKTSAQPSAPYYSDDIKRSNIGSTAAAAAPVPRQNDLSETGQKSSRSSNPAPRSANDLTVNTSVRGPPSKPPPTRQSPSALTTAPAAQCVLRSYNSVADHCQQCSRYGRKSTPTHYCHSCDEYNCVLCEACSTELHSQDLAHHDVEPIEREPAVAAVSPDEEFARVLNLSQNLVEEDNSWSCDACTMRNKAEHNFCEACETKRPGYEPQKPNDDDVVLVEEQGWHCEVCTYLNRPHRPSCYQCASDRPADYQIPPDYVPKEDERKFIDGQLASQLALQQENEVDRDAVVAAETALLREDEDQIE